MLALNSSLVGAAYEPVAEEPSADEASKSEPHTSGSATTEERVRDLLDDPTPRTWVFSGDSLGFGVRHAKRGWVEHFSDLIKGEYGRPHDVILDTSIRDATLEGLKTNLDWRVLRFQPDVVILTTGVSGRSTSPDSIEQVGTMLAEVAGRLDEEGCIVVLCTPPSVVLQPAESIINCVERIRATAEQTDSILVDNFQRWLLSDSEKSLKSLLDSSGERPSKEGHRKLTRQLLRSLNLPFPADDDSEV